MPGRRPSPDRAPTRPGAPNARPGRSEGCEEDATAPYVALGRDRGCQRALEAKQKKLRGRSIKAPPLVQQERASNKRGEERKRENVAYRRLASGRALQRLRGTGGRRNRRKERERGSERGLGYDHRIAQHLQRAGEREGVDT